MSEFCSKVILDTLKRTLGLAHGEYMSITLTEVEHLAKLARINLSGAEKEKYAKDLSAILDYVKQLQQVKRVQRAVGRAEAPGPSQWRADAVIGTSTAEQEELLSQVPERSDRLVKTKPVFK